MPFAHHIEAVSGQVGQRLLTFPSGHRTSAWSNCRDAQSKVDAQVVLRQITSSADHLAKLHKISRSYPHARVQRKPVALDSLQLKADPMVLRPPSGRRIIGSPTRFSATASTRPSLNRSPKASPRLTCGIWSAGPTRRLMFWNVPSCRFRNSSFGSQIARRRVCCIYLRIHVPGDLEKVLPAVIGKINKRVAPTNETLRPLRNSRRNGDISKVHAAFVGIKRGVFHIEVGDHQRNAPACR